MGATARGEYDRRTVEIRRGFELNGDGLRAVAARAALVDEFVVRFWGEELRANPKLSRGVAIAAIGGYGRAELYPHSDVDLLCCVEKAAKVEAKDAIRRMSQSLWDCGLQVALTTRTVGECDRLDAANPEFGLSLLDLRQVGGDEALFAKLSGAVAKMRARDMKGFGAALMRLTSERHAKYGNTLFHLEPNIKDCPGGLRDVHVCQWLRGLRDSKGNGGGAGEGFGEAVAFLAALRCFLHYRRERDDNTLDWQTQDAAAQARVGLGGSSQERVDAAYWMRVYFRHARVVERSLLGEGENAGLQMEVVKPVQRVKIPERAGFLLRDGVAHLKADAEAGIDSAHDPEIVMAVFACMAESGARLSQRSQERIASAIPKLSAHLEEGPKLWRQLSAILMGKRAGQALRVMHTVGVLDLIVPEFHGIDALVIRDAYHRYTVDEHTFVLIDVLHELEEDAGNKAPEWRVRFGAMIRELQQPGLLYLAGLLHDTGKGRASEHHAVESARMAKGVLDRLEMDAYDTGLVMQLIENHLEMSAAMRRDIFDAETVRAFVGKVQTHEALRMLTLFTYADIAAVHPDALTPWKVENLWRLWMAAANQLDRSVDEERVRARVAGGAIGGWRKDEKVARVISLARGRHVEVEQFLEGFPERYVRTRSPETMLQHFEMTRLFSSEPFQITFQQGTAVLGAAVHEITLVTQDRPRLFAGMASALAAWGMNVVTADAFANEAGVVVDSFRFTDAFRTLELNESERTRFVGSVRELVAGRSPVEKLLSGRRRGKRKPPRVVVATKVDFDEAASTHSTLLQVIAQDVPGLLRAISATLSEHGYNVEVALVDTEGETAIDVFYITSDGNRLSAEQKRVLGQALSAAIEENAG
ncbi:MAG: ACT domain-containing protein [Acidobacteria bacterium]|nr:ACT domain-containing protein [Acidobacteriota bacterium]